MLAGNGERAPAWQRRKLFREPEILAGAAALLEESGVEQMAMSEVARRAGVSEATVYKYFESKEILIARAIETALTPTIAAMEEDVRLISGTEARLRLFVARSLRDMEARPHVHRAAHGPMRWAGNMKSTLHDLHRRFGRLVNWIFTQGVIAGEISKDADLRLAGDMIFGGIEGVGWRVLMSAGDAHKDFDIDAHAIRFVDQLLSGIGQRGGDAGMALCDRLETLIDRLEGRSP